MMNNDYTGIARAVRLTVEVTAEEAAAILHAYDYGVAGAVKASPETRAALDRLMDKIKPQIWR